MPNYNSVACSAFVSYVPDLQRNYILGTTFMRNFYITFDYGAQTMTFTSKWTSTTPITYFGMSGITILIVLVGVAVLLLYIGVLIYCCIRNKKMRELEKKQEAVEKVEEKEDAEKAVAVRETLIGEEREEGPTDNLIPSEQQYNYGYSYDDRGSEGRGYQQQEYNSQF